MDDSYYINILLLSHKLFNLRIYGLFLLILPNINKRDLGGLLVQSLAQTGDPMPFWPNGYPIS